MQKEMNLDNEISSLEFYFPEQINDGSKVHAIYTLTKQVTYRYTALQLSLITYIICILFKLLEL